MNGYCLMDGAMVYGMVSRSKIFADKKSPWLAPLLAHDDLRLAGPFLVAYEMFEKDSPEWQEFLRAVNAFPYPIHTSDIQSGLGLQDLAKHMRQFASFRDSDGDTYGLRIADGRVLAYLSKVLTQEQWDALTAPMVSWTAKGRRNEEVTLPLSETRLGNTGLPDAIQLSEEQIAKLIQAGEPDALLAHLELDPPRIEAKYLQWHYDTANYCVTLWRRHEAQRGEAARRGMLWDFARRVFASNGAWLKDDVRVRQELRAAAASAH